MVVLECWTLEQLRTVIGSNQVADFLNSLHPEIRKEVKRCACNITFRFGNHGTLKSEHAMIVPIEGLQLKIAIVPGSTPFLLSNTLLRALEAVIDTKAQVIVAKKSGRTIPLTLTSKGLFLVDLNDLVGQPSQLTAKSHDAETHSTVDELPKKSLMQSHTISPVSQSNFEPTSKTSIIMDNQHERNNHNGPSKCASPQSPPACTDFTPDIGKNTTKASVQPYRSKCEPHRNCCQSPGYQHVAVEAPSADAGQEPADQARLLRPVPRRDGSNEDCLWAPATGQAIQGGMGSRTILGDVVHSALREQPEIRTPDLFALHREEGGASRGDSASHPSHQCASEDQDSCPRDNQKAEPCPRALPCPSARTMVRPPASQEIHHEFDYDLDPDNFEVIPELEDVASQNLPEENNPHVLAMEQRLYQMENLMSRVVQHLEAQAAMPEPADQ